MTKKKERSLADFDAEDLLKTPELEEEDPIEEEEVETEEETEEEEEKVEPPKKGKTKEKAPVVKKEAPKKEKVVTKKEEPIEEEEEEEEVEPVEEEEQETPQAFYQAVDKITGSSLEVEYGDIDPLSPQGVAIREKAVSERAIDSFLDQLEQKQPKAYRAIEHALAGGSIEDLFTPGDKDYSKIEIKEEDEDHAKVILREYYQKKNITNEGRIKRMIEADEESEEGLVKSAQGALAEMKAAQETDRKQIIEEQKVRAQKQQAQDQRVLDDIDKIVGSLQISSFRIPSKRDAEDFSAFVKNSIQRDGKGGYLLVTPLDGASMEKQLQAEYFRFKKGDLEKLITTKAVSKNAEQLRLRLKKQEGAPRTTVGEDRKKVRSLKDFEV